MDDSQIVSSLLDFYSRQGVDLYYVLDDPTFVKLPIQSKVQAIKDNAAKIVAGTHPGFTPMDRKNLVSRALRLGVQGGIAGATAGAALGVVSKGVPAYIPALLGAISGMTAGASTGALQSLQETSQRKAIRNQLDTTSRDPSTSNALGALSIKGIHARQSSHMNEWYSALRRAAEDKVTDASMNNLIAGHIARHVSATQSTPTN